MAKNSKRKRSENDRQVVKKARYSAPSGRSRYTRTRVGFGEAKYVDVAAFAYAANTTGSIGHVSIVPTGTTVNSRDGKNFRCTSVQVRGYWKADTTTTTSSGMALLVWDRQPNKALAAITDIMDTTASTAFIKRENQQRFKIIRKWRYCATGNSSTPATGKELYDIDDYIKLPAECVASCTTADTTGAIGNRISGALLFLTMGDTAAGTADLDCNVAIRTNFVEV